MKNKYSYRIKTIYTKSEKVWYVPQKKKSTLFWYTWYTIGRYRKGFGDLGFHSYSEAKKIIDDDKIIEHLLEEDKLRVTKTIEKYTYIK